MGVSRADNSIKIWHNLTISNPKPDLHNINAHTMCIKYGSLGHIYVTMFCVLHVVHQLKLDFGIQLQLMYYM